jgi:hypothetical protein
MIGGGPRGVRNFSAKVNTRYMLAENAPGLSASASRAPDRGRATERSRRVGRR